MQRAYLKLEKNYKPRTNFRNQKRHRWFVENNVTRERNLHWMMTILNNECNDLKYFFLQEN